LDLLTSKIAFLSMMTPARMARIAPLVPEGYSMAAAASLDTPALEAVVADAEYIITGGAVAVPGSLMRAAPKLKLVHKWGVGYDEIDLEAARALGVQVARTTGLNAIPVAEFAIGLMLSYGRCIPRAHKGMQAGKWMKGELSPQTIMLSQRTVGIIGLGTIGKNVAQRLKGFGSKVLYLNRNRLSAAEEAELGVEYRELPELLAESDMLTLTCPLTPQTRGLIGAAQFAQMKRSAVLVNVARGEVVVEADLIAALRDGTIAGAALDVFDVEPPPADHPLLHMDNVVVTPHLAGAAGDNAPRELAHMFGNIARVARGESVLERDRLA
jgi:phosphoglycerate dehydrogenase-like enzyme